MKSDLLYLEKWFNELQKNIKNLQEDAKTRGLKLLFSISTTAIINDTNNPYTTPVRLLERSLITGVVIYSQAQVIIATNIVKDFVDGYVVDIENKYDLNINSNIDELNYFQNKYLISKDKEDSYFKHKSIIDIVRSIVDTQKIIEYKANDITVDAIWTFLSTKMNFLSGKKISIIGCGNIGSKLALKLVESNASVIIMRKNSQKGKLIAEAINTIKSTLCRGQVTYNSSAIEASKHCDVIISTANTNIPVVTLDMVKNLSKNGFIIDVGKGNIENIAIQKAIDNGIRVYRGDVSAALYGFVSQVQQMQDILQTKIGRSNIGSNINIVSGGFLGGCGDIVVDSFISPRLIYGIADGKGNMKVNVSSIDLKNIEILKKVILKNKNL